MRVEYLPHPRMESLAAVEAHHLAQVVDDLEALPERTCQPRSREHRVDEVGGILVVVVLAIDEAGHRHVRDDVDQPGTLLGLRLVDGGEGQGGDRAGRRPAQADEAQPRLLQHVDVAEQGDAEDSAPLHDQVDVLVAFSVQHVAVCAAMQFLRAQLLEQGGDVMEKVCSLERHGVPRLGATRAAQVIRST